MKENKGISLIVLVITIIVIVILAGAVILSLASNNPISQADKAMYLNDVRTFQSELELYKGKQYIDNLGGYNTKLLQADDTCITYNGKLDSSKTINDIITTLKQNDKYAGLFEVVDGELIFRGSNSNQQTWAESIGLQVIVSGEPTITITPPNETVVVKGTNIVYTIKFSSSAPLSTINLTDKIEILDDKDVVLPTQPNIIIGTPSGTSSNVTRQLDVTIETNNLPNGEYKLKIKAGAVIDGDGKSNTRDAISSIGFDVNTIVQENPVMVASPSAWTNTNVNVTITYSSNSLTKEYSLDGTNWTSYINPIIVSENNITVYARGKDVAGNESGIATLTVANIDRDLPVIVYETNGQTDIKVANTKVSVSDIGGSNISTLQYIWDTQNTSEPTSGWTVFTSGQVLTKTGDGTWYLWIKSSDGAGNIIVEKSNAFVLDNTSPVNPIISAAPSGWTNSNVTVTITYPQDASIKEYSTNGTLWQTYTSDIIVTTNGITVYARCSDIAGNQSGQSTLTITNIDKTQPIVSFGTNGGSDTTNASTSVTVSDAGGSELDTSSLQYVWAVQNSVTPTSSWVSFTNGNTITLSNITGKYYLWIKSADNAGNILYSTSNVFTAPKIENKPVLATGMTAKVWDGTTWQTVTDPNNDTTWYDYSNQQWANAQTADGSMWVWIPRYIYKISSGWHSNTVGTIDIQFSKGTNDDWNSAVIGSIVSGTSSNTSNNTWTNHPAFTFGSTQLTGIWVAKFQATGTTSSVSIKPGIASITNINIDTAFTAARNMETNSTYGWGTTGSGIDTHLMKNVEWGAAAYLAHSIYGRNGVEISMNTTAFSGAGSGSTAYITNVDQSTTGNVYGIYDMNGGIFEYVASYISSTAADLTTFGGSLVSASAQYKEVYSKSSQDLPTTNLASAVNKKGDAIYETSVNSNGNYAWFNDGAFFPCSTFMEFIARGYTYTDNNNSGIFSYSTVGNGVGVTKYGFRPTLIVGSGL